MNCDSTYKGRRVDESSVFFNIFDEAQRAWDAEKSGTGFTEPEGLFRVGEKIYEERGHAVLMGLYGIGQVIYKIEYSILEYKCNTKSYKKCFILLCIVIIKIKCYIMIRWFSHLKFISMKG